jgi:phosphate transport system protein
MFQKVENAIQVQTQYVEQFIGYLSVSRYLERMADHATNIAEDVIYLVEGHIVRHSGGVY